MMPESEMRECLNLIQQIAQWLVKGSLVLGLCATLFARFSDLTFLWYLVAFLAGSAVSWAVAWWAAGDLARTLPAKFEQR